MTMHLSTNNKLLTPWATNSIVRQARNRTRGPWGGVLARLNKEVRIVNERKRILAAPLNRRTVVKSAVGAAAGFYASGMAGKSYRRARAQDDVLAQILAIPGAGEQPTESDMEKVGELCLRSDKKDKFQGQTVTFIGLNNAGYHNNIFRPLSQAWADYTGATINWIDVPQGEVFSKVQQGIATGEIEFDVLEGGAPWEGDLLGRGLCSVMPDWVMSQIEIDDYVNLVKAPVGTWEGETYRISIDGDCHNFNYRSDIFSDAALGEAWAADGGEGEWGVPTTWQQMNAYTKFLKGKTLDSTGEDLYGFLDAVKPGGGFTWYFFASRASAYAKFPGDPAWLFNPDNMDPYVNNPAFVRALQDMIDTIDYQPADQKNADLLTTLGQILSGQGAACAWWGDVGSNVYTNDASIVQDKMGFSILPGSTDVYNNKAAAWETPDGGPNFAPNEAYIGWGLYVMKKSEERGVNEAAWDLAAHLGGKDLSTWTTIYPSGFQPYRNSHFNLQYWTDAGLPPEFAESYLASQADSYNHPNGAIEPRIPGIFDYYIAAEEEVSKAVAGEKSAEDALNAAAAKWQEITDRLGREEQLKLYQGALG
jgi:multiple sugar transport system substrate-binding protein